MLALGWLMPWGTPGLGREWYVRAKLTPPGCALLNYMQTLSALPARNLLTALLPLRGQCVAHQRPHAHLLLGMHSCMRWLGGRERKPSHTESARAAA